MMDDATEEGQPRSFEDYWEILKRRRWWILLPAVVAWALATAASWVIPPRYRSETVILVEQPAVPAQYVTPNVTVDLQSRMQSLSEQILSRTRLLRIIDELRLYPDSRTDPDLLVRRMRADTVIDVISAPGDRSVSGFKISFSASNPWVAQKVAGSLTQLFIAENLQTQQHLSRGTTEFLQAEVEAARKDLEQQEAQLSAFRRQHLGELPEQLQSNMQILAGLQARLDGANQALNHAEQQKLYLTSLLDQYRGPRAAVNASGSGPESIDARLGRLQSQLEEARSRYTAKHPDVVHLKQEIAEAEQRKRAAEKPATAVAGSEEMADTPTLQLRGQLKTIDLEIANGRKQIRDLELQIAAYQARLNLAPARDQQLAGLTRNYTQSRTNYEALLAKRMQSQMATNLEARQKGEQFRTLDPPGFPRKPYFPKRLYFALGGLAGGVLIGLVLAVGMELLTGRIYHERDLVGLGTAVIGIVPPLLTSEEVKSAAHRRRLEWAVAAFILTLIPVITVVSSMKG